MMRQLLSFLTSLLLVTASAAAQDAESPFDPLDLPTPNHYRASTGEPGEAYWQQRADYRITATLNPIDKTIRGSETIEYANNSPYELGHLWIQLDQNLFRPGSRGSEIQPPESRWRGSFEGGGYEIMNVNVAGRPAEFMISDTRMRIDLADPLPPGVAGVEISMDFSFR
ncbi:MAG: M1 family peptidase, partial [Rhodothermales bacterium]